MHAFRDRAQALRPVIDRITASHHRQQDLRRTDVAGRFLPPDMLLARLQGKTQGRATGSVDRHADEAARHRALMGIRCREKCRVWPAKTEGHAETLGAADRDIRPPFAGRRQ